MLITNGMLVQPGMRRRTVQRQVSLGPISLRIVTIVIISAAVLMALMQSTSAATKSYELTKLEQVKQQKENDIDLTNTDVARLRALNQDNALQQPSDANKLVAPAKIDSLPNTGLSEVASSVNR